MADDAPQVTPPWCLTCDKPEGEGGCHCALNDILLFEEVQEWVLEEGLEPYAEGAQCGTCIFQYAVHCAPYREWLLDYALDIPAETTTHANGPAQLDGCGDYRRD